MRGGNTNIVVRRDPATGDRATLPSSVPLVEGNVGDALLLQGLFSSQRFGAVLHFAGSILVPESIANPLLYYRNNTVNSHALITACVSAGGVPFVFSSTAAVYGLPAAVPASEEAPLHPISPYGRSKVMTERMLADADAAHFHHISPEMLRTAFFALKREAAPGVDGLI